MQLCRTVIIACFSLFVKRFPKKVSGSIWNAPLRMRVRGTLIHIQPPPDGVPSGGFMIDIGFYINALYSVVSTSLSSTAVGAMTTKPSAVMVIALPAAAMAWAGITYVMP